MEKGGDKKGQWRQVPRSHLCKPPSLTDTAGAALPGWDTTLPPSQVEGQLRSSACQAGAPGTSLGAPSPRGIAPGEHLPGILCVCPAPYIFISCSQRDTQGASTGGERTLASAHRELGMARSCGLRPGCVTQPTGRGQLPSAHWALVSSAAS